MGEFDVILEDQFMNAHPLQEPRWFPLESRRTGKKKSIVTGEIQIQFSLVDTSSPSTPPEQLIQKFLAIAGNSPSPDEEEAELLLRADSNMTDVEDDENSSDEALDESKRAEKREKRRKRLRLAKLRKKAKQMSGYEYSSNGDVAGVLFLEIQRITDLPPERNGMYPLLYYLCASSRPPSDKDLLRHGPIRCDLPRQEDLPNEDGQPQSQSCFR
jgi:phosphatidylserine decarboxylase